jgi:hypothetical protein
VKISLIELHKDSRQTHKIYILIKELPQHDWLEGQTPEALLIKMQHKQKQTIKSRIIIGHM